jgi:hypothetical protein
VNFVSLGGLRMMIVAVVEHGRQERRFLGARQNRPPMLPCARVLQLVNRWMIAAVRLGDRGSGRISAGGRIRRVLSRERGWLPARRSNLAIVAPLTLLGEGAASLERPVAAAAIAVGIALASKPRQLS